MGFDPIVGMAMGALIGGGVELVVQLPLCGGKVSVGWVLDWRDEGLRRICNLVMPAARGTFRHPDQYFY